MLVYEFKLCNIVSYDGIWAHVLKYWFKCWHTDLKSQEFSICQQLNLYCAVIPYIGILFHAAKCYFIFLQIFQCLYAGTLSHISTYGLKYCNILCWLLISYVEMLIHMLKFEFLYYNIGEYLEIWVQKLAPYKNWTNNSLYLIPLQIKNHRKVISKIAFGRNVCN